MRMFALDASQIEHTWGDYVHLIEKFADSTGEMSAEQVKAAAMDATMQLWGLQDDDDVHGIVATEIVNTARGLICTICLASGDVPVGYQKRLLDEIGRWAKSNNCVAVRLVGRRGWLKRFPFFRKTGIVAEWNLRTN